MKMDLRLILISATCLFYGVVPAVGTSLLAAAAVKGAVIGAGLAGIALSNDGGEKVVVNPPYSTAAEEAIVEEPKPHPQLVYFKPIYPAAERRQPEVVYFRSIHSGGVPIEVEEVIPQVFHNKPIHPGAADVEAVEVVKPHPQVIQYKPIQPVNLVPLATISSTSPVAGKLSKFWDSISVAIQMKTRAVGDLLRSLRGPPRIVLINVKTTTTPRPVVHEIVSVPKPIKTYPIPDVVDCDKK